MKVLAIQSSPNHDGLTAETATRFLDGAKSKGHDTELIHLNDSVIKKCKACDRGWGQCKSEGTCVLVDDFAGIVEKMLDADVVFFTTPVYWWDISESAKTFLDRLRRVETHFDFKRFNDTRYVGVACAGGSGNGAARALYLLEEYLKRIGFRCYDLVTVTQANKAYKLPMMEEAGKRL